MWQEVLTLLPPTPKIPVKIPVKMKSLIIFLNAQLKVKEIQSRVIERNVNPHFSRTFQHLIVNGDSLRA
jgi:hypothetical protein